MELDARTEAGVASVLLLLASLVPSPLERHPEWKWTGPDKLLHLLGHAMYAATLAEALEETGCSDRLAAVLSVLASTVHGLVAGRLQRWVPGREFEPQDVLAGVLGSGLAVLIRYLRRRRDANPR